MFVKHFFQIGDSRVEIRYREKRSWWLSASTTRFDTFFVWFYYVDFRTDIRNIFCVFI